jgi:hypothetical protein
MAHFPSHHFLDAVTRLLPAYRLDPDEGDINQFFLRDILTDCRHYSDLHGCDFFTALDSSYKVYLDECATRNQRPSSSS